MTTISPSTLPTWSMSSSSTSPPGSMRWETCHTFSCFFSHLIQSPPTLKIHYITSTASTSPSLFSSASISFFLLIYLYFLSVSLYHLFSVSDYFQFLCLYLLFLFICVSFFSIYAYHSNPFLFCIWLCISSFSTSISYLFISLLPQGCPPDPRRGHTAPHEFRGGATSAWDTGVEDVLVWLQAQPGEGSRCPLHPSLPMTLMDVAVTSNDPPVWLQHVLVTSNGDLCILVMVQAWLLFLVVFVWPWPDWWEHGDCGDLWLAWVLSPSSWWLVTLVFPGELQVWGGLSTSPNYFGEFMFQVIVGYPGDPRVH